MSRFQVRRATVEDLPQLRPLWQVENLPIDALEKRLTEFQVAQTDRGEVVAALGLQAAEGQGRVHSEAIAWFDQADELRAQLWPRIETLARSQGLGRIWTSLEAPFWKGVGFKKAAVETFALLPGAFADEKGAWLQMPLGGADAAGADVVEKQIAVLRAMSQAETQRLLDRARVMKWIALGLFTLVFGAFAVWVVSFVYVSRRRRKSQQNRDL